MSAANGCEKFIMADNTGTFVIVNDCQETFEPADTAETFVMLREGSMPIVFDSEPTEGSTNLLTSGAIYGALRDFSSVDMSFVGKGLVITTGS